MDEEIWKDIKGFENKYQISNLGRIKSLNFNNTNKKKIMIPKLKKNNGLLEIILNKNNKHNYRMVARLVIEAFTDIQLKRNDIIMYKDGNKLNCNLDNLYIITRGKRQEITYDRDRRYVKKYEYYGKEVTIKELSKVNGLSRKLINGRLSKLHWSSYEAAEIPKSIYKR